MLKRLTFALLATLVVLVGWDKLRPSGPAAPLSPAGTATADLGSTTGEAREAAERRRAAAIRRIEAAAGQTYLDSLILGTDSLIRRWPQGGLLRVALVTSGVETRPHLQALVLDAAALWEHEGLGFQFVFQNDTTNSQIRIAWAPKLDGRRTGQTDLVWDDRGWIRGADITLALTAPDGRALPDNVIKSIAVHELGHAVGLPHSAEPSDMMFPETVVSVLSPRDRATAYLLYQLEPGSLKKRMSLPEGGS